MILTNTLLIDHLTLVPVIVPLAGGMAALILRRIHQVQAWTALTSMLISLAGSLAMLNQVWRTGTPIVFQSGGWEAPFGITLIADMLSAVFMVMIYLVMTAGVIYAIGSKDKVVGYPSFYPLFLTLATGLAGTIMTGDLFTMYVFAELLVISGTVLTAASDDRYGTEAAYKYYYISLMASFFMLLGVGGLYVSYGTLNMADLAQRVAADGSPSLLMPSIAFLIAMFMVKSAVFPFHFWQPDFHTAAPTAVSAMLSSVVVKFGVYGFLRMTTLLFVAQAPAIRGVLSVLGAAGILYGGLSAIGTHNVKRMLAYSTLAQVGFILVAIGWGTLPALAAAIVFSFNHSLIKAALLMLAGYVASRASVKSAAFSVVTGVGRLLPGAGVLFFIGSMGLAGIPPTNGFISKMFLFTSGIDAEKKGMLLFIAAASVLTLIYTMRAFQRVWWHDPGEGIYVKPAGDRLMAPILLIGFVIGLGLWAEPLAAAAQATSQWLGDPAGYIQAVLGGRP